MTNDQIVRIAEAVHDRLMNGPIKKLQESIEGIENHLDRQDATMKNMEGTVERLSNAWDQFQGAG